MYNDFFTELQNLTIEEIQNRMEQFTFNDTEQKAVNSGKETINNMVKLNNYSSNIVGWYLVLYAIYKLKGGK